MKNVFESKKGITLIALTITIVVLVILGGVLVALTISDSGLLGKTRNAKEVYEFNSAYEIVRLKILEATAEHLIQENSVNAKIDYLKDYMAQDDQVNIEIVRYESVAYIKEGLEPYSGRLKGFYVVVPQFNKYTFLIGEQGNIDEVSDDGINFIYIRNFKKKLGIDDETEEMTEAEKEYLNAKATETIEDDILEEIAETLGIPKNEANIDDISENMTQAEMEHLLEKYGTIQYDDNYNIVGVELAQTGTVIPISQIYSGTYKAETSTVTTGQTYNFTKTNSEQKQQEFTIEKTGEYVVECWGAQGGGRGGYGAYTCGIIRFRKGDKVYICIGEQGASSTNEEGGFNGGGYSPTTELSAGGGATDIRLVQGENIDDTESLASRIMVAGGGAGGYIVQGLHGGALTSKVDADAFTGTIASQTSGGTNATFGKAANTNGYPGAGGGYYGGSYCSFNGFTGNNADGLWIGTEGETVYLPTAGTYRVKYGHDTRWVTKDFTGSVTLSNGVFGDPTPGIVKAGYLLSGTVYLSTGGSSYISGHEGCIAIKSATDITPKVSEYSQLSDSIHYTGRYFRDTYMCAGDETAENGESGNSGDGRVRITAI